MRDLFLRYPNVIAYVAGHTHANAIDLFRKGRTGFWQINTASHIDWPAAEPADRGDGQPRRHAVAVRARILDHAAPIAAPAPGTAAAALTDTQLSSLGRVLAFNDPQKTEHLGRRRDRNAELVLLDPRT